MDEIIPTTTYQVSGGRIHGKIDGLSAMTQAIEKVLVTERFEDLIYRGIYGVEFDRLIGQSFDFIEADLSRTIQEALQVDDRILGVSNFRIDRDANLASNNEIHCFFEVETIHGIVHAERSLLR